MAYWRAYGYKVSRGIDIVIGVDPKWTTAAVGAVDSQTRQAKVCKSVVEVRYGITGGELNDVGV